MLLHFITAPREKRQAGTVASNHTTPESIWTELIDRYADTAKPRPEPAVSTRPDHTSLSQAA